MKNDRLQRLGWILTAMLLVPVLPSCPVIGNLFDSIFPGGNEDQDQVPPPGGGGGGGGGATCDVAVTPATVQLDCDLGPVSAVVQVSNLGTRTLNWTSNASACSGVIQVVPSQGALSPGNAQNVTISVTDCGLVSAIVNCTVVFNSTCGSSGLDAASVAVTILPGVISFGPGRLTLGRVLHTSNLLPANPVADHGPEVFIAGGADTATSSTDTAEIISPIDSPDGVQLFPTMSSPRMGHSSVLQTQTGKDEVYLIGGDDNSGGLINPGGGPPSPVNSIDVFDATTQAFSSAALAGPHGFGNASALLADGRVLITGGMDGAGNSLSTAEVFDPTTCASTPTSGDMGDYRLLHTATYVVTPQGDGVLVAGGDDSSGIPSAYYEIYDPNTDVFSFAGYLCVPRSGHTATTLLDGRVLLAGGFDQFVDALPDVEIYDPTTMVASSVAPMNAARQFHTANLVPNLGSGQGGVVVTGGADGTGVGLSSVEFYDPLLDEWTGCTSLMVARAGHTSELVPLDGTGGYALVIAGGTDAVDPVLGNILDDTEIYDPSTCGMSPATATKGGGGAVPALSLLDPDNELSGKIVTRDVTIPYTLYHPEGRPQLVYVEWTADQGRTWHAARKARGSERLTVATARPEGSRHRFVWDSWTDLPGFTGLVTIRIRTYNGLLSEGEQIHLIVDNP